MGVDTLQKAETMEDKKKHRDEGHCFEWSKQGHMAWNCPTKKFNPRTPQKPSYIKMVQNHEYDEEEEAEEYEEEEEEPQEQDKIDDLVSRMVSFSDEKKVQWMNVMQDRGVDFLAAWMIQPSFGQCFQTIHSSLTLKQYTPK